MKVNDRDFVGAMGKGLAVIEAFDASSQRMTLSEVARKTGLTRPTARRYLLSLTRLRYAETDGKHFWLTHRVLRLGHAFLSSSPLPKSIQPVLDQLAEGTKEAASLSTMDGPEIVFLASSVAPRMMAATINVGLHLPAYCTASGRILLASLSEAAIERLLRAAVSRKFTPKTRTSRQELLKEIRNARRNAYAVNDEELEIGVRSIAVAVAVPQLQKNFAMAVSVHAGRMSVTEMVARILPKLQSGKRSLEQVL
ncbi:MAG: hypothetical protein A3H32_10570 [Betaproteobacteria bacterium RIFCSPLOWO2_02_FULL_63_19]|nr:MAG: hypothetical protein A3H32_10570 [Betaproteobacteria bacterium RIFCSPLOWO2_02_FULL_63_19]